MAGVSSNESIPTGQERALAELGTAVASRPLNTDRVKVASEEVRRIGGTGLLVEAAATAGAFEAITKVVDATIRRAKSGGMLVAAHGIMTLLKNRALVLVAVAATVAAYIFLA